MKTNLNTSSEKICQVLSEMDNTKDVFNFVRDLLSEKEILEFSRRFEVADLLDQKISYSKIEKQTSMSSTTIARISKFLKGENKGYKNAIKILKTTYARHHEGHHSK